MAKIDKLDISTKALSLRQTMGEDSFSPIDIFALVQRQKDITLIMYPLGENISGYCRKYEHTNIIVINSGMTIGRQRYSLAHELYHIYYDTDMSSFVCSNFNNKSVNEQKADLFASYFLMPQDALEKFKIKKPVQLIDIIDMEQYYRISRKALLYRLLNDGIITNDEFENFSHNVKLSAKMAGYNDSLYNSSPENERYYVYGKYITDAENLLNSGKISVGKYEEYLLTAYRDDLVFGYEDGGEVVD
ncbi:MAG: ImmA/IrrE family metallo-endopeptidase [Lachnospiraceae bacterium]|jgi:Zn-dependent peptidase ImmA (M78 family)|nr:ImmA/IrrE family metallo-endopeptidase [Lachnospiraceae bacterium]